MLPQSIPLHIDLIQAYADDQKTDEALATCDKVLQQHPDQVAVLMMKSDLLEQKNDTAGSIRTLERAYRLAPSHEDLCYNLAFKFAQSKDPKVLTLCDSLLQNDTIEKKAEPWYFKGVCITAISIRKQKHWNILIRLFSLIIPFLTRIWIKDKFCTMKGNMLKLLAYFN